MKKPSYNKSKYEDNIKLKASYYLHQNLGPKITIVMVILNDDYTLATLYWDTLFDEKELSLKIDDHKKSLRSYLAKTLQVKSIPEIRFIYSSQMEDQKRIEELLTK